MNDVRTKIVDTLRATQREGIENVIDYMDRNGFYIGRCHKHHRYQGGLADHSWEVFQHALLLSKGDNDIDKDSLAICALLHDFCKCSGMCQYGGHGRRSVRMLNDLGLHLSEEEFLAIRYHMGQHGRTMDAQRLKALNCKYRKYVHKADNMSSVLGWSKDFISGRK